MRNESKDKIKLEHKMDFEKGLIEFKTQTQD